MYLQFILFLKTEMGKSSQNKFGKTWSHDGEEQELMLLESSMSYMLMTWEIVLPFNL